MSRAYRVVASPDRILDDRDFGAMLVRKDGETVLCVPIMLLPLLVDRVINTSDLFYALVLTDPRAVAKYLDWSLDQVAKALRGLRAVLQGTTQPRKTG